MAVTVTPRRDTKPPFAFVTRGRLTPPAHVRPEDGCQGRVTVQVKRGRRTISARRTQVERDCTFTKRVSFRRPRRLGNARRLKFIVLFQGNKVLLPQKARSRYVRIA